MVYSTKTIRLFLFLFITLLPVFGYSQAIETVPAFPSEADDITIIFNAEEEESQNFVGYSGDVYAHTGVIISEEDKNSGAWSYVKNDWVENTEDTKLTRTGNSTWELQINNVREYYDIPETVEKIYQLTFVFRSADTNVQTSPDLFVDLYDGEIQVRFSSPSVQGDNPFFAGLNSSVEFEVIGNSPAGTLSSITLFQGETELATVEDSDTLRFETQVANAGQTLFSAVAEDNAGGIAEDEISIFVNPEVPENPRPQGIEDGITYHNSGTEVTFSLFAPSKDFVYLIGDHSDWGVDEGYFMNRHEIRPDSVHFWITVNDFEPGNTYRFQYLVDGEIRVADPYSELVLHPQFDTFISEDIYPDMPQYPDGLTSNIVSVIEPGSEEYEWQITDFEKPAVDELVIYELLVRDFLEESSYEVLTDTLSYLENLGVNAIELMPVSEFDGNLSWGYNPVFHGALDKAYGSKNAFKRFIDEAHRRGIAVLLDVVYNQAHDDSPLVRMFGTNRSSSFENGNPLLGPGHAYNVFFHLNHDHPYIQYWLDRMNRYWLDEYNIDGYRFDLTKGFASNVNNRSLLDGTNPQRIANLKRMYDQIRTYNNDAIIILEHFGSNAEEIELTNYGMLVWGNHNYNYSEGVMGYNNGSNSNMSGIYFGNRNFDNPHLVGFMESHDEQWLMHKARNFGNQDNPDHDTQELDVALQRMKLAGAFFFTIPGPKMLWQFGELGYGWADGECLKPGDGSSGDCRPQDPGRTAEKPIRWDYYDDENRNRLYQSWSELTRLRQSSPVFTDRNTDFSSSLSGDTKWIRLEHEEMDAMIIGNFGVEENSISADFSSAGDWFDFITGETLSLSEPSADFILAPGEFRIYTSEQVDPARSEVFFPIGEDSFGTVPEEFNLLPNYPNPFNPTTTLVYDVPEEAPVEITVYDMLGRKISTLVNENSHRPGSFNISFDGSSLGSGVYLVRLRTDRTSKVQKMTLLK
jgi:1,4-alpha-glucan branching enzyme